MKKKVVPIEFSKIENEKQMRLPDAVLEAFNQLIVEKFNRGRSIIKQKEVVALMIEKGLQESDIYDKGWLDIGEVYKLAGWKVGYDKPGYDEDYDAFFTFSKLSN